LPNGLPKGRKLIKGAHLFEKIHGKDPYLMVNYLTQFHGGTTAYKLTEIA
ncbi:4Fe-4S ferredoxin, partial [bacterium]|nr:4Fe-4S ferredoxin [bacterium]